MKTVTIMEKKMTKLMRITSVILILGLLGAGISGCTNISDDGTRTKTEGTLVGAGAGAAVGAGIGALLGGGRGALIGGLIGAASGGLAGYFVGDHIASKKSDYASQEEWLDACITQAKQVNAEAAQYNTQLKKEIAAYDKEATKLAADYKKNTASKDALQAESKAIAKKSDEIKTNIAALENEVKNQKAVAEDAHTNGNTTQETAINKEIASLEKQIKQMQDYNSKLASISVRVAV
jgi:uncharacterized protein YcfJ